MNVYGTDISQFQASVPAEGDFIICRALGHDPAYAISLPDIRFREHWANAKGRFRFGRGAYAFVLPGDGRAQAEQFLSLVPADDPPELGYWADLERAVDLGTALSFVARLKEARVKVGFYSNPSFLRERLGGAFGELPWWVASYGPNDGAVHPPNVTRSYLIHQYASFDGSVHLDRNVADASGLQAWRDKGAVMDIDNLPFVGAAHRKPRPVGVTPDLIVLHDGETNEGATAAEGMANYFASGATIGSAHICVDNDSAVRCAWDWERTNGAGGVNDDGLHIEQAGRAGQSFYEWRDDYSTAVVHNCADVCRQWIAKFPNIRPVFLWADQLRAGERNGITTHNEVSRAGFAGNDGHWDPGPEYPIGLLLELVRGAPQEEDVKGTFVKDKKNGWVYLFHAGMLTPVFSVDAANLMVACGQVTPGSHPGTSHDNPLYLEHSRIQEFPLYGDVQPRGWPNPENVPASQGGRGAG